MNRIRNRISHKFQQYQLESQTQPLQNAPVLIKILAIAYQLIGRKIIAKFLVSSSQCNGCNICVEVCPNKAILVKRNNPRRNRRCKGCLLCVYSCPVRAFELPVISLVGAILLLFLPYDEWIIKLFSINFIPDIKLVKSIISLLLWGIGYAPAVFIFEKSVHFLSTFRIFKKFGEKPMVKKMRDRIHPALIFPALNSVPEKL